MQIENAPKSSPQIIDQSVKKSPLVLHTKKAREYSFLGMYEEALRAYTEAMTELENRKKQAKGRPEMLESYSNLQKDLQDEIKLLNYLSSIVKTGLLPRYEEGLQRRDTDPNDKKLPFNAPPFAFHHHQKNGSADERDRRGVNQQNDNFGQQNFPPRLNPHLPFSQKQIPPTYFEENRNQFRNNNNQNNNNNDQFGGTPVFQPNLGNNFDQNSGFHGQPQYNMGSRKIQPSGHFENVGYQKQKPHSFGEPAPDFGMGNFNQNYQESGKQQRNQMNNQIKDPMIWDPPTTKPSQNYKPVPKRMAESPKKTGSKNKNEGQGGRNYDRPWMKGLPDKKDAKKSDPEGKYKFLYSHYPDGNGPDTDLIRMIEDDLITINPNITFDDIAGLKDAKESLLMYVVMALNMKDFFKDIRSPPKGILLFGPPGTGKTMLAKAIATTGKTTFLNVNPATLASKWRGDSEKLVRILFEMARFYAPSTIFIDEIDSLLSERSNNEHESSRKVKTQFFTEIDGIVSNTGANDAPPPRVFILAATNRPWDLDEAILRRLTKRIYIPLPNEESRRKLFLMNLKGIKLKDDIDYDFLVKSTERYNSDDIVSVCREASMAPLKRRMLCLAQQQATAFLKNLEEEMLNEEITMEDFKSALQNVKSSASDKYTAQYEEWMKDHGSN